MKWVPIYFLLGERASCWGKVEVVAHFVSDTWSTSVPISLPSSPRVTTPLFSLSPPHRTTSVSGLMYVKEDIILPHTVTFYDLIRNKVQGKSGPLFQFALAEHAVAAFDPRLKSQDSHAGKVVDRHWYSKNKHIFPASRWEAFDADKLLTREKAG